MGAAGGGFGAALYARSAAVLKPTPELLPCTWSWAAGVERSGLALGPHLVQASAAGLQAGELRAAFAVRTVFFSQPYSFAPRNKNMVLALVGLPFRCSEQCPTPSLRHVAGKGTAGSALAVL